MTTREDYFDCLRNRVRVAMRHHERRRVRTFAQEVWT